MGFVGAVAALGAQARPQPGTRLPFDQIPASFFIPAVSHLHHPGMIPAIQKSGRHEIGVHGWIHGHLPSVNDAAAEQDRLNPGDVRMHRQDEEPALVVGDGTKS